MFFARDDGPRAFQTGRRPIFFDELEEPVLERRTAARIDERDPLAPATSQKLERAVMAKWVVPAPAEERMRGPRAPAQTFLRVITPRAVAP